MSQGNLLYLLMCLSVFAAFAAVLANESRLQSRRARDQAPSRADAPASAYHA
jgi:hypothetical protein